MRVWTCVDHAGHQPTGTASVVVAENEEAARALLDDALVGVGLDPTLYTLNELDLTEPSALILRDGDY